jgi:hypothetical protein
LRRRRQFCLAREAQHPKYGDLCALCARTLFILRYRAWATGSWLLFEKKFGFFLGGHETLLRFKLRNAEPPDVEFALVNGAVTRIVPKDAALVLVERGEAREIYAIFGLTRQS